MKSYTITVNGTAYEVTVEETGSVSAPTAAPVAAPKAAPAAAPKAAAPAAGAGWRYRCGAVRLPHPKVQVFSINPSSMIKIGTERSAAPRPIGSYAIFSCGYEYTGTQGRPK